MGWLGRSVLLAPATWPLLLVAACGARTGLIGARAHDGDGGLTVPDGMTLADGMTLDDGTMPDVQEAQLQTCPRGSIPLDGGCALPIAAGDYHTCAMTSGGVQCWGANGSGQLGNNSTIESNVPVSVSGLGSGVIAIAAGGFHTCALTGGGLQCWGADSSGELGNNSNTESNVPVAVTGLGSGATAIAAGFYHTCALTRGGGAQCWGDNVFGELGNNSTIESNVPAPVLGLGSGVTATAPGGNHTCALTSDGDVQCWGLDSSGQLGNGSTNTSLAPVAVLGPGPNVLAIAAGGFHSCALTSGGGVQCWGDNTYGELGNDSTTNSNQPVPVAGLGSGVTAIAAGGNHTCALTSEGGVQCWGSNTYGELGNDSTTNSSVPVAVLGLGSGVTTIATGWDHTCAGTQLGTVQCWGDNEYGQLGNNSTTNSSVPVAVVGF